MPVTNSKSYQLLAYHDCLAGASSDTLAALISQRDTIVLLLSGKASSVGWDCGKLKLAQATIPIILPNSSSA